MLLIDNQQLTNLPAIYQCFARNEYGSIQADIYVSNTMFTAKKQPKMSLSSSDDLETSKTNNNNNNNAAAANIANKQPQIILGPQNTTIYEGQSVVLLCVTSGESSSASAQINWLQNDLIIEPTLMRRFEINQLLGNLRIVSVQKSDAGVYKCIASNEFGMSTAEAYVTVKSVGASNNNKINGKKIRKINQILIKIHFC